MTFKVILNEEDAEEQMRLNIASCKNFTQLPPHVYFGFTRIATFSHIVLNKCACYIACAKNRDKGIYYSFGIIESSDMESIVNGLSYTSIEGCYNFSATYKAAMEEALEKFNDALSS